MIYLTSREQLLSHGPVALKSLVLDCLEAGLRRADPARAVYETVKLEGETLLVKGQKIPLSQDQRIILLGAGKASYPIAKALESILGERIIDGVIICKHGQPGTLQRCRLYHAAHPIPDRQGLEASMEALRLAESTRADDIVFGCVTGGSSALMPLPAAGISLEDKQEANQILLGCGADITEINAVRKHLSRIKGGRLAMALHPGARLINLTVSDVINDPLDYITDPTVPDTSFFHNARQTLDKYELWERIPASVRQHLERADPAEETPKEKDLAKRFRLDIILVPGTAACEGAAGKASELGYQPFVLSTMFRGESRELGRHLAAVAKEIVLNHRPFAPPCLLICGGETTVKLSENPGSGGPNQEFVLGAALELEGMPGVVAAGLDTDGTDGPTEAAGGLADETSLLRAGRLGLDLEAALKQNNALPALKQLDDLILTGSTGTNVNDLKLIGISAEPITQSWLRPQPNTEEKGH